MATHSYILAWRIPWTEEPGGLQSMGLQGVGHALVTKQQPPSILSSWLRQHKHIRPGHQNVPHPSSEPFTCLESRNTEMLKIQFLTSRKTDYQQRAKWGYPSTTDQMQGQCGGGGLVTKSCLTLVTTWTIVLQAPLSMGFSRQEYLKGLPCCLSGDCPDPRIEPISYVSCIGRQVVYH